MMCIDREKLDKFLEASMENELVVDGVVAQDGSQSAAFWRIREVVFSYCLLDGGILCVRTVGGWE